MDGGSLVATCEFCGRRFFSTCAGDYEDDEELAELISLSERDPDHYVAWEEDYVPRGTIDGRTVVIGCPCNKLSRYELFIWAERRTILRYLEARTRAEATVLRVQEGALARATAADKDLAEMQR